MTDALDLEHVARPRLPWRDESRSECGLTPHKHRRMITRDEFVAKVRKQGKERSAMTTCMTCWHTALRHPTFEEDPVRALSRETSNWDNERFRDELLALAALVEAHRDDFDAALAGLRDVGRLDSARSERRSAALRRRYER